MRFLLTGIRFFLHKNCKPRSSGQSVNEWRENDEDRNNTNQEIIVIFRKEESEYQKIDNHKSHVISVAHIQGALIESGLRYQIFMTMRTLFIHFIKIT